MMLDRVRKVSDYIAEYKKNSSGHETEQIAQAFRIALLASFTITGLKETMLGKCRESGIHASCYEAPYNQVAQTILNLSSSFYEFVPNLTVVFVDIMDLLGEDFFFPYSRSHDERRTAAEVCTKNIVAWVEKILSGTTGRVLLHNFCVPYYSPLGILENKQEFGFFAMIKMINDLLEKKFRDRNDVFVFDYDAFCSKYGKIRVTDPKMYYLGDFKLCFDAMPFLCDEYLSYIKPLTSRTRKCLVLDLDNTLWGGVVGEEGIAGIQIGPTPGGRPFLEFQKSILSLHDRGVLLAINSNNNLEDVDRVFQERREMVLRKEHFSAYEINWDDKVSNMRSIAKKLNIGLDALVFLDDLPSNRRIIREALPEVLVPEMPEDPSEFLRVLGMITDFNTLQLTEEDRARNRLYAAERLRQEGRDLVPDIDSYLKGLNLKMTISPVNPLNISRISQLTQKTNQFNMTTRRYLEEDIRRFTGDPSFFVYAVKVEDRFGDSGITGVLVIEQKDRQWRIDTFLLSCRVLGRKIEHAILAVLIGRAKQAGIGLLVGEFRPTPKNSPARDFYKSNGFRLKSKKNEIETWVRDTSVAYSQPTIIEVLWKD